MVGRRLLRILVALAVAASMLAAPAVGSGATGSRTAQSRPNIVFVLTDDLAWNLVTKRYMPHVIQLERQGMTFDHYIVTDSLCCPSRSSIFTGLFPHDTGVFKNKGKDGGYYAFTHHHPNLETKTYAVAIQPRGYLTSMMGKYLNGYGEPTMTKKVPPGWNDWHVGAKGYPEFNYQLNENRTIKSYGGPTGSCGVTGKPDNYMVDVLAARATSLINRAASAHQPFAMEVATFAPHYPYTPAPRNACDFPGLKEPRDSSFNTNNTNPPKWLGHRKSLTNKQKSKIDSQFRMRAQSVEAVDKLIGRLEGTLAARGLNKNTYIVFSSDNGYHMAQHRLLPGKQTAFDTDIRVPLIIVGPGVPHANNSRVVENIDLYPTFVQLAGGTPSSSIDGHSLVPLLHPPPGNVPVTWRTAALIEHHGPDKDVTDPDFENGALGGNPKSYEAIRLSSHQYGNAVYVEYNDGEREYYNIDKDQFERHNTYKNLSLIERAQLDNIVRHLKQCHGASACWKAGVLQH